MRMRALALVAALSLLPAGRARGAEPPCTCPASTASAEAAAGADGGAAPPLDLNVADERALLSLPGIGPARARAILEYREKHAGFRSVSQLLHIKGIGRALLRRLRALVTVTQGAP